MTDTPPRRGPRPAPRPGSRQPQPPSQRPPREGPRREGPRRERQAEPEYVEIRHDRVPRWIPVLVVVAVVIGLLGFGAVKGYRAAVDALRDDPAPPRTTAAPLPVTRVLIKEGFTVDQTIAAINEAVPRLTVESLEAALADGSVTSTLKPEGVASWEGLLFPATYDVTDAMSAADVLGRMAEEMEVRTERLGLAADLASINETWGLQLTTYDLLKVASLIEAEGAFPDHAAKIGTVTYNRLRDGMRLQYDATSAYEARLEGRDPTRIDYEVDTPYNTRTRTGLPPTPISSPGEVALEGALRPAEGDWLYFVLTDTTEITFTVSYADFLEAKAICAERQLGCG